MSCCKAKGIYSVHCAVIQFCIRCSHCRHALAWIRRGRNRFKGSMYLLRLFIAKWSRLSCFPIAPLYSRESTRDRQTIYINEKTSYRVPYYDTLLDLSQVAATKGSKGHADSDSNESARCTMDALKSSEKNYRAARKRVHVRKRKSEENGPQNAKCAFVIWQVYATVNFTTEKF